MAIESPRTSAGTGVADKRRSRVDDCRRLLEERDLDVLVVTSPASVFYLTGFLVSAYTRLVAVVLVRGERPRLIVPAIEGPIAERLAWDGVIAEYSGDRPQAHELVANPDLRSIGGELDTLPPALAEDLRRNIGGAALKDVSAALDPLWWNKAPAEITYIRHAGELCEVAIRRAEGTIAAGDPELVAKAEGDHAALSAAAQRYPDERIQLFSNVVTGARTTAGGGHDLPTGRRAEIGDLAFFVWAVSAEGYWALMTRSAASGTPTPAAQSVMHRVEAAKQAALKSVRPGVEIATVFNAAAAAMGSGERDLTFSVGRGIGARMGETPVIAADSRLQLTSGMVLRLGPEAFGGFGAIGMIDTVAVTDNGFDVLTSGKGARSGMHKGVE